MSDTYVGGVLTMGYNLANNIDNNNLLSNIKNTIQYDADLMEQKDLGLVHTIMNKPLYVFEKTFINDSLSIKPKFWSEKPSLTVSGDSIIHSGNLNINTYKNIALTQTPLAVVMEYHLDMHRHK